MQVEGPKLIGQVKAAGSIGAYIAASLAFPKLGELGPSQEIFQTLLGDQNLSSSFWAAASGISLSHVATLIPKFKENARSGMNGDLAKAMKAATKKAIKDLPAELEKYDGLNEPEKQALLVVCEGLKNLEWQDEEFSAEEVQVYLHGQFNLLEQLTTPEGLAQLKKRSTLDMPEDGRLELVLAQAFFIVFEDAFHIELKNTEASRNAYFIALLEQAARVNHDHQEKLNQILGVIEKLEKGNEKVQKLASELKKVKNEIIAHLTRIEGKVDELLRIARKESQNPNMQTILSDPPQNNELFEGRDDELEKIALLLKQGSDVVLVNGIGGIGKSSLAQEYWRRHKNEYQSMAWVLVQQDNLRISLLYAMAEALNLTEMLKETTDQEQQFNLLKDALRSLPKPGLLVLDNANHAEDLNQSKGWLDNLGWHLLLTSRAKPSSRYKTLEVNELPVEMAMQVFLNYYDDTKLPDLADVEKETLRALITEAERHTLLIEILAKVGRLRKRTMAQLLAWWKEAELSHPDLQALVAETQHQKFTGAQGQLRLETYMEALMKPEELEQDLQDLLRNFCLFPAEEQKIKDLHTLFLEDKADAFTLEQNLQTLEESGWLQGGKEGYRMHPVVADLCLRILEPNTENCEALLARLVGLLGQELGASWDWVDLGKAVAQNCAGVSRQLGILYGKVGDSYEELGWMESSLRHWGKANHIFVALKDQKNLAISISKLGDLNQEMGDLPEALSFFEKGKELAEQLFLQDPRSERFQHGLAISFSKLGKLHKDLGNLHKALDFFEKVNYLFEQFFRDNPHSERLQHDVAISYYELGKLHQALGDLPKALAYFENSNKLFEIFYEANPQIESHQHGLAASFSSLGDLHQELGNLPKALEFFEKTKKLLEQFYSDNPRSENFQHDLAISYLNLGDLNMAMGDLPKALGFFEKRKELAEKLHNSIPLSERRKNSLAISYERLGDLHQAYEDLPKALDFFKKFKELMEELYQANPRSESLKSGLAISYEKLGQLHQALGDLPKALDFFEKYNYLYEQLYQANPRSESLKNGLAFSFDRLGKMHQVLGDLPKSLDFFEKRKDLGEQLYQANPNNQEFARGLVISYWKLAFIQEKMENATEALAWFQKALPLYEKIVSQSHLPADEKRLGVLKEQIARLESLPPSN
ncbi:MAG TPA: tetratricopeptide repeat protein [Catalimonadaceae bacterium]|nr:tetratricopeptide repeat protein [Catalimonadaceae bacterium]